MKKSYYAIIPANVRYDESLTPNAKLLYGEITALCNQEGYCWAKNSYFANLYDVKKETISRWVSDLVKRGYIKTQIIYKDGTKEIKDRYVFLNHGGIDEIVMTPTDEKVKGNSTSINNTSNSIYTLFVYWNGQEIIKHRKMNQAMQSHINARLQEYSLDELKQAITNYSTILNSDDYYWTHKWSLQDFMKPNNVTRFVDEANPIDNFKSSKAKTSNKEIDWSEL